MKAFVAGFGVGAVVAMFLAPQNGKKTRATLADRFADLFDRLRMRQTGHAVDPSQSQHLPESEAVAEVLNTAGRDELMSVDGIGKATAKRIIKNRPYETEEEVLEVGVIPEETLDRLKEQLADRIRDVA